MILSTAIALADVGADPNILPSLWLRLVDSGLSFMLFGVAIYYFVKKESRTELLIGSVIQRSVEVMLRLEQLLQRFVEEKKGDK